MTSARVATAAAGLLLSIAISAVLWWLLGTPAVFLLVPFVPFFFRRETAPDRRRCPACGFETTRESHEFCPRDGRRLRRTDGDRSAEDDAESDRGQA